MNPVVLKPASEADVTPASSVERKRLFPRLLNLTRALVGWSWRLVVGAVLCGNVVGAVLVIGFLTRRSRAVTVRAWWRKSGERAAGTFDDFVGRFDNAPDLRPRWVLRNRLRATASKPGANLVVAWRWLGLPFGSLGRNFWHGAVELAGTFLLCGWGMVLMTAGWEYGWLNSFHKGYERAPAGATVTLLGMFLFTAAFFFLPVAQAHFAMTGRIVAFADFRFVGRLVRQTPLAWAFLAVLTLGLGFVFELFKTAPAFWPQAFEPWLETATPRQQLEFMEGFTFNMGLLLFTGLVVLRGLAARFYARAVLRGLRRGSLTPADLPDECRRWLGRLDLLPRDGEVRRGHWGWAVPRAGVRYTGYGIIAAAGATLAVVGLIGEFFNYHPVVGFLNRPVLMLPCVDYIPDGLRKSAEGG